MLFDKRELTITYDLKRQMLIRETLEKENINYVINPILMSWSLNRCQAEYKFYVKKSDYERAMYIIKYL